MSTLRGNLRSISLTDVVQLLNVNRKTGKLIVTQGKGSGVLYVLNGDVVHAETPEILGESGAFEILEWEEGEFEFITTKVKVPVTIKRSVPDLLMEAARTTDTRKHLRTVFPSLQEVPCPALHGPGLTQGLRIYDEDRRCIPFLDGYRTFLEVMAASGQSEVSVLQACAHLKEAGRLKVLDPSIRLTVQTLKTGLFRKGEHVEAAPVHEASWQGLGGPWRQVENLRILWPEGVAVGPCRFVKGMGDKILGVPKELMQSWGLPEGMVITVRPAP